MSRARPQPEPDTAELSRLFHALRRKIPYVEAKQAGIELCAAPRLNAFNLFAPGEVSFSWVLADFWNPKGAHGQGALFLNALLEHACLTRVSAHDPVVVHTEYTFPTGRRIDQLIETPTSLLGIEIKLGAKEGNEQLPDYANSLRRMAGQRKDRLVFLAQDQPSNCAVHLPHVADGGEACLCAILANCLPEIMAPRTKLHVEEMIAFLGLQFKDVGAMPNAQDQAVIDAVLEEYDRGNRKAVAMSLLAGSALHRRIIDEIETALRAAIPCPPERVEKIEKGTLFDQLARKDSWTLRDRSWPNNLGIGIAAEKQPFSHVFYGILAPDGRLTGDQSEHCEARKLMLRVASTVPGAPTRHTHWYPWWKTLPAEPWDAEYTARLVMEADDGSVVGTQVVRQLSDQLIFLWKAVQSALMDEPSDG